MHPAHASRISLAGGHATVRREFEMICRIEERFGPLKELGARLDACALTARELFDLYRVLLVNVQPPVPDEVIKRQIMAAGWAGVIADIAPIISAFFFGEEEFMKRVAEQVAKANPPMAPEAGPAPSAAGSIGDNSSAPPRVSAGSPMNSGAQPSTNSPPPSPRGSTNGLAYPTA